MFMSMLNTGDMVWWDKRVGISIKGKRHGGSKPVTDVTLDATKYLRHPTYDITLLS